MDAQKMIAGWENTLRGQVASPHYKDVDERTAAHELYGYKAALRDLGLLDPGRLLRPPGHLRGGPGAAPQEARRSSSPMCATSFAATTSGDDARAARRGLCAVLP